MSLFARIILTEMLLLLFGSSLGAQEATVVSDESSCPKCSINTERLFELGGPTDTTGIVHTNFLPMDSRGRVYFQSLYAPGSIHVFDVQGKHVHSFGREGEGPGEFKSYGALFVAPGDSLFVFDAGNYRLSVFSPKYEFVRSSRFGIRPSDGFFRTDGTMIISGTGRKPETFGLPLHLLSAEGALQGSFGGIEAEVIDSRASRMLERD